MYNCATAPLCGVVSTVHYYTRARGDRTDHRCTTVPLQLCYCSWSRRPGISPVWTTSAGWNLGITGVSPL
eukprot:2985398-Pyramimonas_sp.AAC.1